MTGRAEPCMSRRRLLRETALGACGAALAWRAYGATSAEPLAAHPLNDRLTSISGAGANVIVLEQPDGLLLVDGGLPERSQELLDFIGARWPNRPIRTLFNTNWWWEHTGANDALGANGVEIIAHENTKLWLGNDFTIDWQDDRRHSPYAAKALPTKTFYTAGEMTFGDEPIKYGYLAQAHTDGDIYVHFPSSNVLVVSDLMSVGQYPIVDFVTGGWIGGMANAARSLLEIADAKTQIVPAAGPAQNRTQLDAYQKMCATLKDRIGQMIKNGKSLEEIVELKPTAEFDGAYGDPELFLAISYKGLWGHIRELGGVL